MDKDNGEIRCTGFGDQCDKFFPMIEEGKVYTLTKGSIRPKRQGNVSCPLSSNPDVQPAVTSIPLTRLTVRCVSMLF